MSDLALIPTSRPMPKLSPALLNWIIDAPDMEWLNMPGGSFIQVPRYRDSGPAVKEEAKRLIEVYRSAVRPPSANYLRAWLQALAMVVRNPVSAAELDAMSGIFAAALGTVPVAAFSQTAWVRALQTFKFWPSPADLFALVKEDADEIMRTLAVLEYIVAEKAAP